MAAAGLYGVISYTVAQRTQEIGVRVALGAEPRSVVQLVAVEGLRLTAIGMAIGTVAALLVSRRHAQRPVRRVAGGSGDIRGGARGLRCDGVRRARSCRRAARSRWIR